jgi:hypothetical protein
MMSTLDLADKVKASLPKNDGKSTSSEGDLTTGEILAEHLLSSLCQSCFSHPWHCRSSLMTAIMKLLTLKGVQWSRRFEVEVLHVAMFVVKDAPTEITVASKEALTFVSILLNLIVKIATPTYSTHPHQHLLSL